jgi:hypothetical protein
VLGRSAASRFTFVQRATAASGTAAKHAAQKDGANVCAKGVRVTSAAVKVDAITLHEKQTIAAVSGSS